MKENKQIAFRRIRGRVVPIKIKNENDLAKGMAAGVAGVAVTVAGAKIYKRAVAASAKAAFKGFSALEKATLRTGQLSFDDLAKAEKIKKLSSDSFRAAHKLASLSGIIKKVSPVIGAGLVGYGALKVVASLDDDHKKDLDPALVAGGSAAVAAIVPKAYEFAKKTFTAGLMNRQTSFNFAKNSVNLETLKRVAAKALKAK